MEVIEVIYWLGMIVLKMRQWVAINIYGGFGISLWTVEITIFAAFLFFRLFFKFRNDDDD